MHAGWSTGDGSIDIGINGWNELLRHGSLQPSHPLKDERWSDRSWLKRLVLLRRSFDYSRAVRKPFVGIKYYQFCRCMSVNHHDEGLIALSDVEVAHMCLAIIHREGFAALNGEGEGAFFCFPDGEQPRRDFGRVTLSGLTIGANWTLAIIVLFAFHIMIVFTFVVHHFLDRFRYVTH